MKFFPRVLLVLSVGLNVAVAVLYWRAPNHYSRPHEAIAKGPERSAAGGMVANSNRLAPGEANAAASDAAAVGPEIWSSLQTDDLKLLVARLRAEGFPPEMLRAMITIQLHEQSIAHRNALLPELNSDTTPYWKSPVRDTKTNNLLEQLNREERKMQRELLGADAEAPDPSPFSRRNLEYLPAEKAEAVRRLIDQSAEEQLAMQSGGSVFVADREKLAAHERALQEAIARTLTPAELTEYQLRTSNVASALRSELSAFNPTEAEFRAIFELSRAFEDQYKTTGPMPNFSRERAEAQKQLVQQIKAVLPPERAAEYERAIDSSYRQTSLVVSRLELPPETAGTVYAVQKEFQQKVQPVYGDRSLSPEARNQQLTALMAEAEAKITETLGPRGFEAYKQYAGSWLQPSRLPALRPTAVAVPASAP
jgi:hypothetical protein